MKQYLLGGFFLLMATTVSAEGLLLDEIEIKAGKETEVDTMEVREVRESNAKDPGEALQSVPGITKLRKGGIANDIVLRGFSKDNINVLVDGAKIYGACPSKMDPPAFHVDFAEVDRIEITKGPYDVTTQGSMGGVVNIASKSAKPGLHSDVIFTYGSFNETNTSTVVSYAEDNYSLLGGFAFKYSNPYEDGNGVKFTEIYPETSAARYRLSEQDSPAYNIKTSWFKTGIKPKDNQDFTFAYTRQEADDVLYPYLTMDADYDDATRVDANYTINNSGEALNSIRIHAFVNNVEHDMTNSKRCASSANPAACSGALPRAYSMRNLASSTTSGVKLEGELKTFGRTTMGIDHYQRNWDATMTTYMTMSGMYMSMASMPDVDVMNTGIYLDQQAEINRKTTLSGGLRFDYTRSKANIDRTSVYSLFYDDTSRCATDESLAGNLKLDYKITDSFSSFVGFGRGVRVPDAEERYYSVSTKVGNPGLKTVKNNEVDLGLKYAMDITLIKAQVFYSDLDDFIVVTDVTSGATTARSYKNVDASMYGGEASLMISLPLDLFASTGIAYSRGKNDTDKTNLQEIPPLRGNLKLRYDNGIFYTELEGICADRQDKIDTSVGEDETAGWGIANFKTGYQLKRLKLAAGVNNLFDRQYSEHSSYLRNPFSANGIIVPEPGRSIYGTIQYSF
ncbi:MAG: TonB-dependent receptor [Proteobacteria bacterium]|nr:TonB-dependent receptor [Pseudomonadota bacterium]MBU1711420.1 TonB-dependent receptor [Pseudomonadota bacterium]